MTRRVDRAATVRQDRSHAAGAVYREAMASIRRMLPLLVLCVVVGCAWLAPLERAATPQVESGLKRALASFAAARALNAVISVAQGTQVAVEPGGVGVVTAPGQLLDPINDLVEQFATLMLWASVAFGAQLALLKIGAYWGVSVLLSVAALAWAWTHWRGLSSGWPTRLLVALLLVRFAVPLAALGSDAAFRGFLAQDYEAAQSDIERSARQMAGLPPANDASQAKESAVERFRRWWSQGDGVEDRVDRFKRAVEGTVEHIVKVIVVFLLQTLVVPLLLLWALVGAGRMAISGADRRGAVRAGAGLSLPG